jgi:glycosyltransferase involved in cell wall biosynthesis
VTVPRINVLINNPFVTDSRAWKLAHWLTRAGWRVTVLARAGEGLPSRDDDEGFEVIRIEQPAPRWLPSPGLPGSDGGRPDGPVHGPIRVVRETAGRGLQALRFGLLARSWATAVGRAAPDADIWQAEGLVTLPLALALGRRRGGRVVYDSRDISVESSRFARLPGPWRRLLAWRERRWARSADALVTVSEPYAAHLEAALGRPVDAIVRNCPPRWTPPDVPPRVLHEQLGLDPDDRVVLYLGQVAPGRGIEQLIAAIGLVERAVLVVAGFGPDYERCRTLAAGQPHADRIHFLPGVPPGEIPSLNAAADVAAVPIQPTTLNHRLTTPTKLFDAIGAGTPVVATDLPGMAPVIRATGCGVLCEPSSPVDLARAIRDVVDASPERRRQFRAACLRAADETYNWETQVDRLLELYRRLGVG